MEKEQKETLIKVIVAAVLGGAGLLVTHFVLPDLPWWAELVIFAVPYLIVGGEVLLEAAKNIAHGEVFDEEFLMALATVGAFVIGEYPEAVFVMVFYQIGELLGDLAVDRSRESIAELMDIRPDTATVLRGGAEVTVSPEEVAVGETVLVRAGDRVPLDGVITRGSTTLDTSALTGESRPAEAEAGDEVFSGSVNLTGAVEVQVTSAYGDSTVARILGLVEDSAENKAKSESFITRFSRVYTPVVVAAAILLAVLPSLLTGEWSVWLPRALSFLVVSCPCALVISVPLTFFCGIGAASSGGVLIKGSNYLEALAAADCVVFDKTGTLTSGTFTVEEVVPADSLGGTMTGAGEKLLELAAGAEDRSAHPIAAAIIAANGGRLDRSRLGASRDLDGARGRGIEAEVDGHVVVAGNAAAMSALGVSFVPCDDGASVVYVAADGAFLGKIRISDAPKADSASAVEELRALDIRDVVMLTGDNEKAAAAAAEKIGISSFRAGMLPADKVAEVEARIGQNKKVVFVGDGINDAPVLARADVGVAMGALGSDAAIEAADVVLMNDAPSRLPWVIRLARRTMRIVRENIVFAIAVKILILVCSALGLFGSASMWLAAFGDVGVMLIAVLNALRALKK